MQQRQYKAFISYRHADNKEPGKEWANWLHTAIETFQIPKDLIGKKNLLGEIIPENISPVFRDEAELPAHANLGAAIKEALDTSKTLIVLCSPAAVDSTYVAQEISYFKAIGRSDSVLGVVISGEPNASWDSSKLLAGFNREDECLPVPMQFEYDENGVKTGQRAEPICADFRTIKTPTEQQSWTLSSFFRDYLIDRGQLDSEAIHMAVEKFQEDQLLMLQKIIAGILKIPLEWLTERDKKTRQILLEKTVLSSLKTDFQWTGGGIPAPHKNEQWGIYSTLSTERPKEELPKLLKAITSALSKKEAAPLTIRTAYWAKDGITNEDNILCLLLDESTGKRYVQKAKTKEGMNYFLAPDIDRRYGSKSHQRPDGNETGTLISIQPKSPFSKSYLMSSTRSASYWDNKSLYVYELCSNGAVNRFSSYKQDSIGIWEQFQENKNAQWDGDIIHDLNHILSHAPKSNLVAFAHGNLNEGAEQGKGWKINVYDISEFSSKLLFTVDYPRECRSDGAKILWSNDGLYFIVTAGASSHTLLVDISKQSSKVVAHRYSDDETKKFGYVCWHPTKNILASFRYIPSPSTSENDNQDPQLKSWIQISDAEYDEVLLRKKMPHGGTVNYITWSPNAKYIALSGRSRTLDIWDLENNTLKTITRGECLTGAPHFSPDSNRIVFKGEFGANSISIWDHVNKERLCHFEGDIENFRESPWHPDGSMLAYQKNRNTLEIKKLGALSNNKEKMHE